MFSVGISTCSPRIRSHVSQFRNCGEQYSTWTCFSPSNFFCFRIKDLYGICGAQSGIEIGYCTSTSIFPAPIKDLFMWELWWIKCHWERSSSRYFFSSLSLLFPPTLRTDVLFIYHGQYKFWLWQASLNKTLLSFSYFTAYISSYLLPNHLLIIHYSSNSSVIVTRWGGHIYCLSWRSLSFLSVPHLFTFVIHCISGVSRGFGRFRPPPSPRNS
jgi:hypothetical protein